MGHENKCANIHGHNYVAFITARANSLDLIGRVIDFSVLKEKVGGWIDQNWDHAFIVFRQDTEVIEAMTSIDQNKPIYIMDTNPTAENMAEYLLEEICPQVLVYEDVEVVKVVIWETENCHATATR